MVGNMVEDMRRSGDRFGKFGRTLGLSLLFALLLISCNVEKTSEPDNEETESGLVIHISKQNNGNGFGSRAVNDWQTRAGVVETDGDEGNIKTLWICAFPKEDDNGKALVKQIIKADESSNEEYLVSIKEGKYDIYFLANLDDYVEGGITESMTEDKLKQLTLNFSSDKQLFADNLPMVCLPENIIQDGKTLGDNGLEIKGKTEIEAPLSFLCSKVRYTILWDKEKVEDGDFKNIELDFEKATAVNVMPTTNLISAKKPANQDVIEWEGLKIGKVEYPEDDSPYFDITENIEFLENLQSLENNTWADNSQRAWQGVVYLPENPSSDDNATKLKFIAKGSNDKEYIYETSGCSLTRGHMYDIVGKITKPSSLDDSGSDSEMKTYRIYFDYDERGIFLDWDGLDLKEAECTNNGIEKIFANNIMYRYFEFKSNTTPQTFRFKFYNWGWENWNNDFSGYIPISIFSEVKGVGIAYIHNNNVTSGCPIKFEKDDVIYFFINKSLTLEGKNFTNAYLWYEDWECTKDKIGVPLLTTSSVSDYLQFETITYEGDPTDYINFYLCVQTDDGKILKTKTYSFSVEEIELKNTLKTKNIYIDSIDEK